MISDEVMLMLILFMCDDNHVLINSTEFTYLCLPSGYCQVVAIRTFVATAILNQIKDIDSKNPIDTL